MFVCLYSSQHSKFMGGIHLQRWHCANCHRREFGLYSWPTADASVSFFRQPWSTTVKFNIICEYKRNITQKLKAWFKIARNKASIQYSNEWRCYGWRDMFVKILEKYQIIFNIFYLFLFWQNSILDSVGGYEFNSYNAVSPYQNVLNRSGS